MTTHIEYPSVRWADYELVDSGEGEKLEKFGRYLLIRPEPKALWSKSMSPQEWLKTAHIRFKPGAGFAKAGKEDSGIWEKLKKADDQWYIRYKLGLPDNVGLVNKPGFSGVIEPTDKASLLVRGLPSGEQEMSLRLGLTSFKHVGVFPEQASNWDYIYRETKRIREAFKAQGKDAHPKVLNLFAYTGAASLAAKAAGADVTHLDSVRQVVTWARGNMEASGLDGIRWVVEDAMKFAAREARRGNVYQGIILDPPAYGHGPDGERWKLDECLFEMMKSIRTILAPKDSFMVLNLYSNGFSPVLGDTVVRQAFSLDANTDLESGELVLRDRFGKNLPLSVFVRLRR